MKKLRTLLIVMLCSSMAIGITSCLSDDDNSNNYKPLTDVQRANQRRAIAGSYRGNIYFVNDSTHSRDSLEMSWTLSAPDSSFVSNDFPASILVHGLSNLQMSQVIRNAGRYRLKGTFIPYINTVDNDNYFTFTLYPDNLKMEFDTEYEGTTHHFAIEFVTQLDTYLPGAAQSARYYSYGAYLSGKMEGYFLIQKISMDGYGVQTNRPVYILGNKI